jgi:Holliday junction resolvase RusA-like endonuclease
MIAMAQGVTPLVGPVAVFLDVYRPRRRGDLDNILKATLDALNGIAYRDDDQVTEIHAQRYEDKALPRVEVSVVPLT